MKKDCERLDRSQSSRPLAPRIFSRLLDRSLLEFSPAVSSGQHNKTMKLKNIFSAVSAAKRGDLEITALALLR